MSEILGYLRSPGWWFATVFVAFVVNVASGLLVDALRNGKIRPSGQQTVRYALIAHGLMTLLASIATGYSSADPDMHAYTWIWGAAFCFFIVKFLTYPIRPLQWGVWLLGLAAILMAGSMIAFSVADTPPPYENWALPFAVYFIGSGASLFVMELFWGIKRQTERDLQRR